jgi:predicted dehydrogenase
VPYYVFIEFSGSDGTIRIERPYKPEQRETIYLFPKTGRVEKVGVRGPEAYLCEVQDMEATLLDGRKPAISLEDSRGTVAAISALLESARSGSPVTLE